jgi:hypothetical protein
MDLCDELMGSPVIIVQVRSHSPDSGSFQFSQSPAKVNGRPSFMAKSERQFRGANSLPASRPCTDLIGICFGHLHEPLKLQGISFLALVFCVGCPAWGLARIMRDVWLHAGSAAIAAGERGGRRRVPLGCVKSAFGGGAEMPFVLHYLSSKNTEWVYFQGYPTLKC